MNTRRTTISDCVTDMVPELAGEARALPEIAPFARRLASHLGLKSFAFIDGGIAPDGIDAQDLPISDIGGDLSETAVLCTGVLERSSNPDEVLDLLAKVLDSSPVVIVTSDASDLVDPDTADDDKAIHQRWTVPELEALLKQRGLPIQHVAVTLTDSYGYNRDTTLIVLGKDELGPLLVTGTWNLHFYQPPAGTTIQQRKPRICIATNEVFGPALCGGIGTAYTSLIEALAAGGHEVTVLFNNFVEIEDEAYWVANYAERGIRFVALDIDPMHHVIPWQHEWMRRAHKTYRWLLEEDQKTPWDCIHFPECNGLGYFTVQAKRQGLGFAGAVMCVGTHGSTRWANGSNGMAFQSLLHLAEDHMERRCVESADVLLGPSRYLLKWMDDRGWALPEQTFQQQYIQPQTARTEERAGLPNPEPITGFNEIVFFGRLETRKGLVNTCDALDRPELADRLVRDGIKVTFLGKAGNVDGVLADEYLKRRSAKWKFAWEQISDKNQKQAVAYLQGEGRLILVPSTVDNSPNTVYECMGLGVAMITARSGGIPELMDPRDVAQATFFHEEEAFRDKPLAKALLNALDNGLVPARPAVAQIPNEKLQLDWHASLAIDHSALPTDEPALQPLTVLIAAKGDCPYLEQCLTSLKAQDLGDFRLLLALDETLPDQATSAEAICADNDGWSAFRTDMLRPGLAKNQLVKKADTDLVVFVEPDAVALPAMLSTLAKVQARTGSALVGSYLHLAAQDDPIAAGAKPPVQTFFPLGGSPAIPLFFPQPGAQTLLMVKSVFQELGGFQPDHRIDVDDCELLVSAMLAGHEMEVVPEELYWSRQPKPFLPGGTSDYRSSRRMLRPYIQHLPENMRWLVSHSRSLDQLHEKRMVEYHDYKWKATEGFDKKNIEFDDYFKWSESEMANIRAHGEDQVTAQKKKTAAAKAELKEAKAKIKALEKAAEAGGKKKGFFK